MVLVYPVTGKPVKAMGCMDLSMLYGFLYLDQLETWELSQRGIDLGLLHRQSSVYASSLFATISLAETVFKLICICFMLLVIWLSSEVRVLYLEVK